MRRLAAIAIVSICSTAAVAADFKRYENGRFGYEIDLPADFGTMLTPENGDGIGLESVDGTGVWGNYVTEGGFAQESDLRRKFESDDGWKFTYEKRSAFGRATPGSKATASSTRGRLRSATMQWAASH